MADAQLMSITAGYPSFVDQLDGRIRPLRCTTEHLEARKNDIIRFTITFNKNNEHLGRIITRPVVEFFWVDEIWRLYPTDHPEKRRLIGQAQSPRYEVYWQKRLDADAFKAKRARQSSAELWSFPRPLTQDEMKDKGTVLLGNHQWEYILPEVQLMPLYHVFFLELAKRIIAANPGKPLGIELMRRLWRLLIRELYDFVSEDERTAKLDEAKAVTDKEFEEATRAVPGNLSKKRGIYPESHSEDESSKSQSQHSKKRKTVRFAETEGSGNQMGADGAEPESSTRPKPSAATNGHQSANSSEFSVQDLKNLEQTRRIADLVAKLATAERQVEEYKRAKDAAKRRWKSQHGQLKAAEGEVHELRRANPNVADYMRARNEAGHKIKSRCGELKRAKVKIVDLEGELRVEKGRTARLEALLTMAGVEARGEKATEAGSEPYQ